MPRLPRGREADAAVAARAALARAVRRYKEHPSPSTERALTEARERYTVERTAWLIDQTLRTVRISPASVGYLTGTVVHHGTAA